MSGGGEAAQCTALELSASLSAEVWWTSHPSCPLHHHHPPPPHPTPFRYRAAGNADVLNCPVIGSIAAATGKTPAQVALRWAVQRGTVPLPRSTTPARVEENLSGALNWALSAEDMRALDAIGAASAPTARIMRGDHLTAEGQDWREVWDEDFDAQVVSGGVSY